MDLLTKEELELIGYTDVEEDSIWVGKSAGFQVFSAGGMSDLPRGLKYQLGHSYEEKLIDLYWQLSFVPGYSKIIEKPKPI